MPRESSRGDPLGGALSDDPDPARRETLRQYVFREDRGHCVGCGRELPEDGGTWSWQAHHVLKQQTFRWRDVGPNKQRILRSLAVLLCRRCHERHENRAAVVPYESLPERVVSAVRALGPWAEDQLRRYHPPNAEGV